MPVLLSPHIHGLSHLTCLPALLAGKLAQTLAKHRVPAQLPGPPCKWHASHPHRACAFAASAAAAGCTIRSWISQTAPLTSTSLSCRRWPTGGRSRQPGCRRWCGWTQGRRWVQVGCFSLLGRQPADGQLFSFKLCWLVCSCHEVWGCAVDLEECNPAAVRHCSSSARSPFPALPCSTF